MDHVFVELADKPLPRDARNARPASGEAAASNGAVRSVRWIDESGRAQIRLQSDLPSIRRYDLLDGVAFVIGKIHELVVSFELPPETVDPDRALSGDISAETAVSLLTRANGLFAAVIVRFAGHEASSHITVLGDWLLSRRIYYGRRGGRSIVSTSPQRVSDELGYDRAVDRSRLLHICLARNLVDENTLFAGVKRLHNDEQLLLGEGGLSLRRIDLSTLAWRSAANGEGPPLCLESGRAMLRRAVELRLRDAAQPLTLLLSSGTDSRVLMAIAHELGHRDVIGVTVGSREGFDEGEVAERFARQHDYACVRVFEQDLDLRGRLERWVEGLGHPPKQYNQLLLSSAMSTLGERGGQLWTGDTAIGFGGTIYMRVQRLRERLRLPSPGWFKLALPLQRVAPARLRQVLWMLALDPREALALSLASGRTYEWTRRSLALFGRRPGPFVPVPEQYDATLATVDRHPADAPELWYWPYHDIVFPSNLRGRRLVADEIGAHLDYPLKDVVLSSFVSSMNRCFPCEGPYDASLARLGLAFKYDVFARWLPRSERHPKAGLIGDLRRWFVDPRKLGEYLDLIRSRECLERGIFDRAVVQALLDRVGRLERIEAQLLWTVLGTELLFRTDLLRPRGQDDAGSASAAA
jgi:hypothetical protein